MKVWSCSQSCAPKVPITYHGYRAGGALAESSCECAGRGQALGRALYGNYRFLPDRPLSVDSLASEALMLMSLRIRPCLVIFYFGVIRTLIPILPIFYNNPRWQFQLRGKTNAHPPLTLLRDSTSTCQVRNTSRELDPSIQPVTSRASKALNSPGASTYCT